MPIVTATTARIRRSVRASEFARVVNATILTNNPDARDGFSNPRATFFDTAADAQVFLTEAANALMAQRIHVGCESTQPFDLGSAIALTPALPRARVLDRASELDRTVMIKGVAIDLGSGQNSIEAVG